MNRSIVIFVALAVLIAHCLAIRTDALGALAPPYDQAYVAYRVARNLVFDGQWSWSPGVSGFESYTSPLWVLICAFAERLSIDINTFVRVFGVIATATSLMFATRFHPERAASLITPMLLAISGAMAAAAVNGTETALMTALVTGSFLAYEHHRGRMLGLFLMLCGWTRDEGWILALVFLFLCLGDRGRQAKASEPQSSLRPFFAPLAGFVLVSGLRFGIDGRLASTWMLDLVDLRQGELANGLAYVRDFFVSTASPWLIVYCIWYLGRRFLSRMGIHALLVILVWIAMIVVQGGGAMPFSESMLPILPILLIAGQEGLITALNSSKRAIRSLAWSSFLLAVLASALASFRAMDIGPLPFKSFQAEWMRATAAPRMGYKDQLGRIGLDEEAQATRALRELAIFMREEVDPRRSVLSPWPGSLAYISGLPVRDMTGRATAAAPNSRPTHSYFPAEIDVLAALARTPDYIVPKWRTKGGPRTNHELALIWYQQLEREFGPASRVQAIEQELGAYEWITVPLGARKKHGTLLRRRDLKLAPQLSATTDDGQLVVHLEHHGHVQLADLVISGVDLAGDTWHLTPTGRLRKAEHVTARAKLLITETGERTVQLLSCALPSASAQGIGELTIVLLNPDAQELHPWTQVTQTLVVRLPE